MLKPHNHPESQLHRVRGMLHSLVEHPVAASWAREALTRYDHRLYIYLYSVAEACNPFPRAVGWRSKCMREAYSHNPRGTPEQVARCKLAATFYLLSEGLYSQPTLPSLTY